MTEKELQDILDELHEVDIEHLNEKALRLFKAIMKIADQRDLYKQKLDEIENADLSIVYMSGFYDGEKKWKDKIKAKIEEAEQKEKKAYIDGTNVAHELCNKMWKNKINSKIEEYEEILDSPIIKEDYKLEVQHIIGVLKELKGDN